MSSSSAALTEKIVSKLLFAIAALSVLIIFGIIGILLKEGLSFFEEVSFKEFFTQTQWSPAIEPRSFGVLPLISATFLVVVGASVIALPRGFSWPFT